jgi:hypothetical protein
MSVWVVNCKPFGERGGVKRTIFPVIVVRIPLRSSRRALRTQLINNIAKIPLLVRRKRFHFFNQSIKI